MSIKNYIPNVEDREFITSLGHWTGEASWVPGPIGSHVGILSIAIELTAHIYAVSLQFPYFKTPPGTTFVIYYSFAFIPASEPEAWMIHSLFNGVSHVFGFGGYYVPDGIWKNQTSYFTVPPGWNQSDVRFMIRCGRSGGSPIVIYWDNFSAPYLSPTRTDHIMVVGVH